VRFVQRPPSAAAEDRNLPRHVGGESAGVRQRPPSAAAEDRNFDKLGTFNWRGMDAAAAVRGGRGSQP